MVLLRKSMLAAILLLLLSSGLYADPCLVVYPEAPCSYHYDPCEYYVVTAGHPLYNPEYARGGMVLLEYGTNEIDLSIYQAPNIVGFVAARDGKDGYFFTGTTFPLIIDGWSNQPTTYTNVIVVFDNVLPKGCIPELSVNGTPLIFTLTGKYHLGDLVVSTPTPEGNNYSDTKSIIISYRGCYGIRFWAFADADYDGVRDDGECFTAFSHDATLPTRETTWGAIKEMYR